MTCCLHWFSSPVSAIAHSTKALDAFLLRSLANRLVPNGQADCNNCKYNHGICNRFRSAVVNHMSGNYSARFELRISCWVTAVVCELHDTEPWPPIVRLDSSRNWNVEHLVPIMWISLNVRSCCLSFKTDAVNPQYLNCFSNLEKDCPSFW